MTDQRAQPVGRCSMDILNDCVPMFEALKDPTRQQIIVHLLQHGPQTVGEIARTSPLSRTAVSHDHEGGDSSHLPGPQRGGSETAQGTGGGVGVRHRDAQA